MLGIERAIAFLLVYYSENYSTFLCQLQYLISIILALLGSGSVPFWAWKSITIHENHCQRKEPPEVRASSKVFSPIRCIPGVDILVVFFNSALSRSICTCSSMHCTSITLSYDTFFSWIPFRFHSNKSIHLYQTQCLFFCN